MKYIVNVSVAGMLIRGKTVYTDYDQALDEVNRLKSEFVGLHAFVSMA